MYRSLILKILIAVTAIFLTPVVKAEPNFWGGFGNMPCREFIELKKLDRLTEPEARILDYVQGFFSGVNIVRLQRKIGDAIDIPERKDISIMIEGICYKDPSKKIGMVSTEITFNLITQGKTFDVSKQK